MSLLFEPLRLRDLTVTNRVWLAPMCQYSARDGLPGDWHLAHLGARAAGGFGLLITEATAVVPEGRITAHDTGLWDDAQIAAWRRITGFVHEQGAAIGVQLAHAGRKASVHRPWAPVQGTVPGAEGGWPTLGPSEQPFPGYAAPAAMTSEQVAAVPEQFAAAARRAHAAGFDAVELHAAHGYLLHQFLSPLTNDRSDRYGGTPANRARLLIEVADAVRAVWPDGKPLLVRVSATDWADGGLQADDVAQVVKELRAHGVDLADVSTGGLVPATVPTAPGYQVPHARTVREVAGITTAAVGLITSAHQAEQVLVVGAADAVLLGRPALRDPHWPLRAARELGDAVAWPPQYQRAAWR
ncbi:NADH:flavin oxidoreductase/NADH oxidase [Xylanimonas ulmi]|uniref:2,4-dienoyl-CoA reductase-like NADH-dependent reductase (Old Yellow Enzyme family) n=1 Tax=Xylanimonas ulmi TaxID=228973 RepID=A0A4Q7M8A3_9MICO|nr:NADH:flavin oxidoreductase/NADH oxidase [Xylanibacterium ulmi]RZS62912.1 2,4-dienoyl-CoA reductase-like NADH-dependent reductase (Old Yellow Enzyme family) [Xylanibacterium ulmi]